MLSILKSGEVRASYMPLKSPNQTVYRQIKPLLKKQADHGRHFCHSTLYFTRYRELKLNFEMQLKC